MLEEILNMIGYMSYEEKKKVMDEIQRQMKLEEERKQLVKKLKG